MLPCSRWQTQHNFRWRTKAKTQGIWIITRLYIVNTCVHLWPFPQTFLLAENQQEKELLPWKGGRREIHIWSDDLKFYLSFRAREKREIYLNNDLLTYHFEAKLPCLPEKVIALRLLQHCSSTPGHPVEALLLFHSHVSSQRCNPCSSDGENSPDGDHRNVPRQVCSFNPIRLPVTRYKKTKCSPRFYYNIRTLSSRWDSE